MATITHAPVQRRVHPAVLLAVGIIAAAVLTASIVASVVSGSAGDAPSPATGGVGVTAVPTVPRHIQNLENEAAGHQPSAEIIVPQHIRDLVDG